MPRINLCVCELCKLNTSMNTSAFLEIIKCLFHHYNKLLLEVDPHNDYIITGITSASPTEYDIYIKNSYDSGNVDTIRHTTSYLTVSNVECDFSIIAKIFEVSCIKINGFRDRHLNEDLISAIVSRSGKELYYLWKHKEKSTLSYSFIKIESFLSRFQV